MKSYGLYIESEGVEFEVRINDVLIHTNKKSSPCDYKVDISQWLRNKKNNFSVSLTEFSTKSDSQNFKAMVRILGNDQITGPHTFKTEPMLQYEWPADEPSLPFKSKEIEFTIKEPKIGAFPWEKEKSEEPTEKMQEELAKASGEILKAFQDKDAKKIVSLNKELLAYQALASGEDLKTYAKEAAEGITQMLADKEFVMKSTPPGDLSEISIVPHWNNRVFEILDLEDEPLISTPRVDGMQMSVGMFLARVHGKWTWVR
ncbi:MAG: hypothetical protein ACI8Y7_000243 [Candidatus Woesearchaeota archaeon]|jgi:hypothetical protein